MAYVGMDKYLYLHLYLHMHLPLPLPHYSGVDQHGILDIPPFLHSRLDCHLGTAAADKAENHMDHNLRASRLGKKESTELVVQAGPKSFFFPCFFFPLLIFHTMSISTPRMCNIRRCS